MYISLDASDHWAPFQLNLPVVPVTDLTVRNNDLVAATAGRAFWVLDDLSPLQQMTEESAAAPLHLYAPRPAVQANFGGGSDGGSRTGQNPPAGAQIFFSFAAAPEGLVTLEILDAAGTAVRTFATDPKEAGNEALSKLPAPTAGLNRLGWDFRTEALPRVEGLMPYGSLQGRQLPPGAYQVRLTHGDATATVPLRVDPDPRRTATLAQYAEQDRVVAGAQEMARDLYESVLSLRSVKEQVEQVVASTADHEASDTIAAAGDALTEKLSGWEGELVQPGQKTFQDVINFLNQLDAQILALVESVDGSEPPVTRGAQDRLRDLAAEWGAHARARDALLQDDLAAFEALLDRLGVPHVILPRPRTGRRPITDDGGGGRGR
jgi:hypothetical protein